ncbi:very short patch repair endonuclease [Pontibacter populi]|uniref:Very short patch repair endonuclease n=1 Tax=Pontibacter populi TaxID=890055 RepID=A0ABV1RSM8_9BACT
MSDVHSKETRSYNMSRIMGADTKPEMLVRRYLFSKGFRYKLHHKGLPGKPDLVFPKYKTALFINGCFWHCHEGCKYFKMPKSRVEFWSNKLEKNRVRDSLVKEQLSQLGWNVFVIWECELKKDKREQTLSNVEEYLKNNEYKR